MENNMVKIKHKFWSKKKKIYIYTYNVLKYKYKEKELKDFKENKIV